MELDEIYKALNKIKHIAVSQEIEKHDLKNIDDFMNCFYQIVSNEVNNVEAYLKIEDIYYSKFGKSRYTSYETFKVAKSRWIKKQKS